MTNLPINKLREIFGDRLQEEVRLTNYTTTRVGGPAAGFISVHTTKEMESTLKTL